MEVNFGEGKKFSVVAEGDVVLCINKVELKPEAKPQYVYVTLNDVDGNNVQSRYDLTNKTSVFILGLLYKTSLNLEDNKCDTSQLKNMVGNYVLCNIAHSQGTKAREDGSFPVFANIKKIISKQKGFPVKADAANDIPNNTWF